MKLGLCTIENFMSIQQASINFSDRGLVLVQGVNNTSQAFKSNGSGKSTLYTETPSWALFGETIRGYKGDAVINRYVGKNTRVSQEVIADNGDVYEIVRHRKHKEHKNHVLMYRNGENITGKSDKDTDKMIVELLEIDFLSFTNSILFGQGVTKMFASSTDSEQKKILERMLRIDILSDCKEVAKDGYDELVSQISALRTELESDRRQVGTLSTQLSELQTLEAELEERAKTKIYELNLLISSYIQDMEDLPKLEDIALMKQELQKELQDIDDKMAEFKPIEQQARELEVELLAIDRDIHVEEKGYLASVSKLSAVRNGKDIPKICDACGQDLPLNDTAAIEKHLEADIEKRGQEVAGLKEDQKTFSGLLERCRQKLEDKAEISKLSLEASIKKTSVLSLEMDTMSKSSNLSDKIGHAQEQIEEQERQRNTTYADVISKLVHQCADLDQHISGVELRIKELEETAGIYKFWVDSFGNQGVKSVMLDSVTPFLNERANYYLGKLADSTIEVRFSTQTQLASGEMRDKFSVEVFNEAGDNDYKGNSGGEKRRIDLAVNLALQDLVSSRSNKSIDLVIYDECFEGLDEVGCEVVISLLEEKASTCGSVMVITHNAELAKLFNKYITVTKEQGGQTRVLEEMV